MMALPKIHVTRLAHVHYQHPDLDRAIAFFEDFGLVKANETDDIVYFRGNGPQPYIYVAEHSPDEQRHFIGGYQARQT
jgi:hypothetical protein